MCLEIVLWLRKVYSNTIQYHTMKEFIMRACSAGGPNQRRWQSLGGKMVSLKEGKGCPYSITERRVPELIPVLGSQPAGDVSHEPGSRLPLLSAMSAVTLATLKRAATNFAAW